VGRGWGWGILACILLAAYTLLDNRLVSLESILSVLPQSLQPSAGRVFQYPALPFSGLVIGWSIFMMGSVFILLKSYRSTQHPLARIRCHYWSMVLFFITVGDALILASIFYKLSFSTILIIVGFTLHIVGIATAVYAYLKRYFHKARYDPTRTLREYSQSISDVLDPKLLSSVTMGLVNHVLEIRHGYLLLVEKEWAESGESQFRVQPMGGEGNGELSGNVLPTGIIPAASPLVDYLCQERQPLVHSDLETLPRFRSMSQGEIDWLSKLDAEVYMPVCTKKDWIGLMVLGPKVSGAPYYDEDIDFLVTLAAQSAVALQTARLVESLGRLNNEFRRAYTALERANQHLARLDRTKSDFISIVSHELRTPISVIRGYGEILAEESTILDNEYYSKMISGINSNILRLNEIVDGMLDMASIDTHALQLATEPVSLHHMIKMTLDGIKKRISGRDLKIKLEDMRDLPEIEADPDELQKVFAHLIYNAVKFTPDGGSISISARPLPPNPEELPEGGIEVIVKDTGIGVSREYQELIFNKFYQTGKVDLHSSGKTKFKGGGQGLGLSIAKGIVEAHGGKIWVESPGYDEEKCPGSQFHVLLPHKVSHVVFKGETVP
jgi:signal transduction histidine kinase